MDKRISEDSTAKVAPTKDILEQYGVRNKGTGLETETDFYTFQGSTWMVNVEGAVTRVATESDWDSQGPIESTDADEYTA